MLNTVVKAQNLAAKDKSGTSDPYCVVWSIKSGEQLMKTKKIMKNLDPVWNEASHLEL